jgi:hypothetical protein
MILLDNEFFENYEKNGKGMLVSYQTKLKLIVNPEEYRTFEDLYLKTLDGTIITLPPFLQRYLQKDVWSNSDYAKAKSFMSSALVATSMFESFIFVKIDVLIMELKGKIQQFKEAKLNEQLVHANKCLDDLELQKRKGAIVAQIDGQSRTKLSIAPYFKNEYKIDKSIVINVFDANTEEYLGYYNLQDKYWKDIPYTIQQLILRTRIYSIVIADGTLDMIVDSLISKQEGEKFTPWQKAYHGKVLSVLGTYIDKSLTQPIRDFWKTHVKQDTIYKSDQAGLEMFIAKLSFYFSNKTFTGVDTLKKVLDGKTDSPSQNLLELVVRYLNEIVSYYGTLTSKDASKLTPVTIINYCLFRWHLDKSDSKETHFTQYNLPKSIQINNTNLFVQKFLEMHKSLSVKIWKDDKTGQQILNTYSYEKISVNGKEQIESKNGGYVAGNRNEKDHLIQWRLMHLSEYFNKFLLEDLKNSAIIKFKLDTMPKYDDVEVFNDFEDTRGEIIDQRTGKKNNHRGHNISKYNNGNNSLSNLKPQPAKDNLQYNKNNLIGT